MKRIIAALTAASMLLTGVLSTMPVMAEENNVTDDQLEIRVSDTYAVVERCAGDATEIVIPAEYNGLPVIEIDSGAFKDCIELTKVVMPDSIESIGFDAFSGCEKLADITFSQNLINVGSNALEDTAWFQNQPDGVIYLGSLAYAYTFSENGEFTIDLKEGTTKILGNFGDEFRHFFDVYYYTLNVPASVTEINLMEGAIGEKCIAVNVAEGNPNYSSIDGVLFNKDKTSLLKFPKGMNVRSYTIPDGVTDIAYLAFNGQKYVEEIVFSDSVTTIAGEAFMSILSLERITFSKNLKYIGENAFFGCRAVTELELPEGLEFIGQSAFSYCDKLSQVNIPASVTELSYGVFRNCPILETITIAEDNARYEMRDGMLYDNQDMILKQCLASVSGEVVIPEGTKDIDTYAFVDADITQITIPEGVEVIRENVFSGCTNLTTISLPTTLTLVEDWAFKDCDALTTVNYAGTEEMWEEVKVETFLNSTFLKAKVNFGNKEPENQEPVEDPYPNMDPEIRDDGTAIVGPMEFLKWQDYYIVWDCQPDAVQAIIPEEIDGVPVKEISIAFRNCTELRKVVMPDSIEKINDEAFAGCRKLGDITFSKNIKSAGLRSLTDTRWFKNQPNGVVYIGTMAYSYKAAEEGEQKIELKDGTTGILKELGENCSVNPDYQYNYTLSIPASVTEIEEGAVFKNCSAFSVAEENNAYSSVDGVLFNKDKTHLLQYPQAKDAETYNIPDDVKVVKNLAFCNSALKEITTPESLTEIENSAFNSCCKLETLTLSEGLLTIGKSAFICCESLKKLHIPASVTTIKPAILAGSKGLEELTVAKENAVFEMNQGLLYNKELGVIVLCPSYLTGKVEVPEGAKTIEQRAFANSKITEVVLPEGVETIGDYAFINSKNLEALALPSTLKIIDAFAFSECDALKTVDYAGTPEMWKSVNGNWELPEEIINFTGQTEEPTIGDLDGNGETGVTDVVLLQKYLLALEKLSEDQAAAADLCEDGQINAFDLAILKHMLLQ